MIFVACLSRVWSSFRMPKLLSSPGSPIINNPLTRMPARTRDGVPVQDSGLEAETLEVGRNRRYADWGA